MLMLARKTGCVLSIVVLLSVSETHAASAETVDGATTIDSTAAKQMWEEGVKFIDVRQGRFDEAHIPGAVSLSIAGSFTEESLSQHVAKDEFGSWYPTSLIQQFMRHELTETGLQGRLIYRIQRLEHLIVKLTSQYRSQLGHLSYLWQSV